MSPPYSHLVVHRLVGHKAERLQQFVRVAGLAVQLAEVNAAAVYAGRGAGLEAAQWHTVGRQILGQRGGRMGAVRAAVMRPPSAVPVAITTHLQL